MKLAGLATTTILVMGCGGSKTANKPAPPPTDPAVTEPVVAPPVEAPPPDIGGYHLNAPDSLTYAAMSPDVEGGPEIAVLHGDLQSGGAFFLRLPPGNKSGLHTHTADYHAVVVSGAPKHWIAGADKKAKPLAIGSHWFQPGGQPHGDECTGTEPCVLFLVMGGALDFTATPKAKKAAVGKYKLTARADAKFAPMDPAQPDGAKVAIVHGDPATGPVGFVIEVPPNGNGGVHSHTSDYHAVVLEGAPAHWLPHEKGEGAALAPSTYWFQPGGYDHGDRCTSAEPCRAFVYMDKAMDMKPAAAK